MSDFGHISKEEHQEWLRLPTTLAAIADLRERLKLANASTINAATASSIDQVRFNAGLAAGIDNAIEYLTRERK